MPSVGEKTPPFQARPVAAPRLDDDVADEQSDERCDHPVRELQHARRLGEVGDHPAVHEGPVGEGETRAPARDVGAEEHETERRQRRGRREVHHAAIGQDG